MSFRNILSLSRPHFWLYELGTFVIGVLAAFVVTGAVTISPMVLLFGLYFLIPANILIYGINDIFDYETDILNPKKDSYEDVLHPEQHKAVWVWIIVTNLPFIIAGLFLPAAAIIALLLFVFFAMFYSAKPIRAKARPFLDSFFSASHYVVTAVFGYALVTGAFTGIIWPLVAASIAWAIAMHAYSAVPDIDADKASNTPTVATFLGGRLTILLCVVLYSYAFVTTGLLVEWWLALPLVFYLLLLGLSIRADEQKLLKIYSYFPWLNSFCGAIITIYLLAQLAL